MMLEVVPIYFYIIEICKEHTSSHAIQQSARTGH